MKERLKEIVEKFHKNFYSKHDIEINSKVRMEVKSKSCFLIFGS